MDKKRAVCTDDHPNGDIKFYSQHELEELAKEAMLTSIECKRITKKSFILTGEKQ